MDPIENNHYCQFTSGESNRSAHLSPPLPGDQTNILMNPAFRWQNEEMIRRIVREEIQVWEVLGKMSHHNLAPRLLSDPKIPAQYQLQFMNKVKNTTFTTDPVRDENGHPIKVAIYDTYTKSIISPDNIISSAKVRLILLDAEFCTDRVNWSPSEFVQNVLRQREGKGPILIGRSLTIQLENGVGTFGNIVFNDNSSWTKSGFRLGVMVEVDGEEGYLNGERVQEGVSEPFQVKDRRVKAAQKPDLLKPKHSVQCIKKIGKSRASFLEKKNIKTVEDFLHCYFNNEPELRNILCIKSESGKEWESMVEHAKQCADEFHAKCNVLNNSSQPCQDCMIIPQLMEKHSSVCTKVGGRAVSWGSSKPNPSEKDKIEAGMPIWPSKNLSNEPISACGEHIVEMQNPPFHEIGDSVQLTNDGRFPHGQSEVLFHTFYSKCNPDIKMDGSGNYGSGNPDIIMDGSGGSSGNYWLGRYFLGNLLLEESQTAGGYSGIFHENRPE